MAKLSSPVQSAAPFVAKNAGVWIDHRKALIVRPGTAVDETTLILSNVEKHPERGGDSPLQGPYEAAQVPADDRRQRALTGELAKYYDAVITALGSCDNLLVFGPGEAKRELERRLAKVKAAGRRVALETADKMTDREAVAKVRDHFGLAHHAPER
jgi:hypothetical protein